VHRSRKEWGCPEHPFGISAENSAKILRPAKQSRLAREPHQETTAHDGAIVDWAKAARQAMLVALGEDRPGRAWRRGGMGRCWTELANFCRPAWRRWSQGMVSAPAVDKRFRVVSSRLAIRKRGFRRRTGGGAVGEHQLGECVQFGPRTGERGVKADNRRDRLFRRGAASLPLHAGLSAFSQRPPRTPARSSVLSPAQQAGRLCTGLAGGETPANPVLRHHAAVAQEA